MGDFKDDIRAAYSPCVVVMASEDARALCARNSLSLETMLRPFTAVHPHSKSCVICVLGLLLTARVQCAVLRTNGLHAFMICPLQPPH